MLRMWKISTVICNNYCCTVFFYLTFSLSFFIFFHILSMLETYLAWLVKRQETKDEREFRVLFFLLSKCICIANQMEAYGTEEKTQSLTKVASQKMLEKFFWRAFFSKVHTIQNRSNHNPNFQFTNLFSLCFHPIIFFSSLPKLLQDFLCVCVCILGQLIARSSHRIY